jgi:hypothetical protein
MLLEATLVRHSCIDVVLPKQVSHFEHYRLHSLFEIQKFVDCLPFEGVLNIELV